MRVIVSHPGRDGTVCPCSGLWSPDGRDRCPLGCAAGATERLLDVAEVAAMWEVRPNTARRMASDGTAPADFPDADTPPARRRPRWRESTAKRVALSRAVAGLI